MISKRGKIRRHRHLNYTSQVMEKYKESSQGIILFVIVHCSFNHVSVSSVG